MKTEELLKKLTRLQGIYNVIFAEIEAYNMDVDSSIYKIWVERKVKIQLALINQFKEEACFDIAHCAWIQSIRKTLEPKTEKGFSAWIENYLKNN